MYLRRGNVLGPLMLGLVTAVLAFMLAGIAVHQLGFSSRQSNMERARNAADSVTAMAIAKMLGNTSYGRPGQAGFDEVLTWGSPNEEQGTLAFNPAKAAPLGLPASTNNLGNDGPVNGWQRVVPSNVAQLVGVGTCRGETRRIEVLLHTPEFPYAIASTGAMKSDGPLLVGQLNADHDALALSPDELLPGHLASNGNAADAVVLSAGSLVTGNVESVGGIVLVPGAHVRGQVHPSAQPVRMPRLDIGAYCPEPGRSQFVPDFLSATTLNGNCIREGSLSVTGGLTLDKSVLYVKGNLTIGGGLRGQGAIIVEGNTTISGGATLESDNKVAILSRGDVGIRGDGQLSCFRGLVYTEGDFDVEDITVVGSFVGNKPSSGGGSQISLKDARVVRDPEPFSLWPDEERYVLDVSVRGSPRWVAQSDWSATGQVLTVYDDAGTPTNLEGSKARNWRPPAESANLLTLRVFAQPGATPGQPNVYTQLEQTTRGKTPLLHETGQRRKWGDELIGWVNADTARGVGLVPMDVLHFVNLDVSRGGLVSQMLDRASKYKPTAIRPINIDLNQFLSPQDRIRVLLWREADLPPAP